MGRGVDLVAVEPGEQVGVIAAAGGGIGARADFEQRLGLEEADAAGQRREARTQFLGVVVNRIAAVAGLAQAHKDNPHALIRAGLVAGDRADLGRVRLLADDLHHLGLVGAHLIGGRAQGHQHRAADKTAVALGQEGLGDQQERRGRAANAEQPHGQRGPFVAQLPGQRAAVEAHHGADNRGDAGLHARLLRFVLEDAGAHHRRE